MKRLRARVSRLAGLFRRDREFDDELASHLEMHVDDGMRRTVPVVENAVQDFRFALRQLRKNPGFAMKAVAMLALGTCASVSIFAFVDTDICQLW